MTEQPVVNVFGLLDVKPQLPRMKLWTPGTCDADGVAVVEPLTVVDAGEDFLTSHREAEVSFENDLNLYWCVHDIVSGWLVRRRLSVTILNSDPRYRLVSNATHSVVRELVFAQDLARSVYEGCAGSLRAFPWRLC